MSDQQRVVQHLDSWRMAVLLLRWQYVSIATQPT